MRDFSRSLIILTISAILVVGSANANADDVFGITIEQRALDVLTLMFQRLAEVRGSADLNEVISMKAKIIVADVMQPDDLMGQVPEMVFLIRIELFKASPDMVRVNLTGSFGELKFLVTESESLAVLQEERVFANVNIPQILSPSIIFEEDDGGLFTMINLLGGIPFGSLLYQPPVSGDSILEQDVIGFTEELDPSEVKVRIRYRGKVKTDAGMVHVVTINTSENVPQKQYIKIWVLEDTLDLYQISIEDERGTEIFLVIDELEINPMTPEETFMLDTSGLAEIDEDAFLGLLGLRMLASPPIDVPVAVDISASSRQVARTGIVTISADGFDLQDKEDQLVCEVDYRSPGGSWTPLSAIEYAGLAPLGHWDIVFAPDDSAELGIYSFRVRFIDSSGNSSDWLEALDLVNVMPAPPRVVRTRPIDGETAVSISTEIAVTFDKPMDRSTVEDSFTVMAESGWKIPGSFKWEDNTLTFSPSDDLQYDTVYLVRIAGEAKDTDGIGLDGNYDMVSDGIPYDDYLWMFTTLPAAPMLSFTPAEKSVYVGDSFDVKIMANYVREMYKFDLKVTFDPEVLEVEEVEKASFKMWRPRPKRIPEADLWIEPVVDAAGLITLTCDGTRTNGVSGGGYIATVRFKAIAEGAASVGFSEASLTDLNESPIKVDLHTSEIQAMEFHPKDANRDGVVNILDFVVIASEGDGVSPAPRVAQFALGRNYPNPFNPETWIPYQLARPSHVVIRIYRSTGELVRTLDLSYKEAGFYTDKTKAAYWDGRDSTGQKASSGVYFYTIQTDGFAATKKMLLCE